MIRFAANLSFLFTEWAFSDRFAAAAEAGFTAVECLVPPGFTPERMADALSSNGLELVNFNACVGDFAAGDRGLAALPDRARQFELELQQAAELAAACQAKRVHIMAGNARGGDPAARAAYERSLSRALELLGPRGIDVLIEPINGRDFPGYFLDDFADAVGWIHRLGPSHLKLQFDLYHRQILHGDVTVALRALAHLIGHIQVAGVPERHEPHLGELNLAHLLRAIDELHYDGFVAAEYRPLAGTLAGLSWFTERLAQSTDRENTD